MTTLAGLGMLVPWLVVIYWCVSTIAGWIRQAMAESAAALEVQLEDANARDDVAMADQIEAQLRDRSARSHRG